MDYNDIQLIVEMLAHPRFKWMCGMKTDCGVRIKSGWQIKKWLKGFHVDDSPLPDISDPATKGCLLAIVRKASKDKEAYVCRFEEGWTVQEWPERQEQEYSSSEGMAMVKYIVRSPKYIND